MPLNRNCLMVYCMSLFLHLVQIVALLSSWPVMLWITYLVRSRLMMVFILGSKVILPLIPLYANA